jgi:cytochrome c
MNRTFFNMASPFQWVSRHTGRKALLGVSLLVGLLALVGCAQGSYPLDIFYEMHYQPTFKSHEPPRLSVPESAVPWFLPPVSTSFTNDGGHLYDVNCSMCHGIDGTGNGEVLQRMTNMYGYTPVLSPNLIAAPAPTVPAGIAGFMRGGVVVMPNFSKLLTDREINLVAEYVVNCLQGQQLQACP